MKFKFQVDTKSVNLTGLIQLTLLEHYEKFDADNRTHCADKLVLVFTSDDKMYSWARNINPGDVLELLPVSDGH